MVSRYRDFKILVALMLDIAGSLALPLEYECVCFIARSNTLVPSHCSVHSHTVLQKQCVLTMAGAVKLLCNQRTWVLSLALDFRSSEAWFAQQTWCKHIINCFVLKYCDFSIMNCYRVTSFSWLLPSILQKFHVCTCSLWKLLYLCVSRRA